MVVVGTRPEAIKLAPVIRAMKASPLLEVVVCATGQHTDMLFPILDWFNIKRDFTLDVMRHQQPLSHLAGKLLSGLFDVIEEVHPDTVMVQGDTTSAFIGGLAAFYSYDHFWKNQLRNTPLHIAHVEAGLRTGDNYSPYPEEINRKLIGHMCDWSFAPTDESAAALRREGITEGIYVTGNTVIDAVFETCEMLKQAPRDVLSHIAPDRKVVLITSHRRENYGSGLEEICRAIKTLSERYPHIDFVYPVHLNHHIKEPVHAMLGGMKNVHLIEPMGYPDFVALMMRSYLILTDSGGVQEEGPSLGKPVLVMRDKTERPEAISAGTAKLIGAHADQIVKETSALIDNEVAYRKMAHAVNPYGDGKASQRIVNLLTGETAENNTFRYAAG
ncbi:MAG TPA: UDP-N-acetylglucosamine 2-epimerase (non-hydrolyzing) [Rickettsiales bacterium]|nr:UDP-N-acetylglucosamine 2-epimerase (non-hydrolyzing) [Rickettsiales bacterium]